MKLSLICIKRPIFASVLSLALLLFGLIGYHYLEIRYFPKVEQPIAQVSVNYPGASPEAMEQNVTRFIENALVNIDGLQSMSSDSSYDWSRVNLTFLPGGNLIKEIGDVRNAVSSVISQLPTDADAPSVNSGGVERPVLNIGFLDEKLSPAQIRDYITQQIQPSMQRLPGMGAVWLFGASQYAMRIWLDPNKMAALGVTVTDVSTMLKANNVDFSAGAIRGPTRNYSIVTDTKIHNAEAFSNLIVRQVKGQVVRLGDIAHVAVGSQSIQDSPMRINGTPAIDMELRPLNTANPITVAKTAKALLSKLRLPEGMRMVVTYDQSEFLSAAIQESFKTLIEAVLLVMFVVYLFLGDFRAALVPIVTIPVCMVSVFGLLCLFGFSINLMTLLGIILATGLVVDDAIVVLENIHRHIEKGASPKNAAITGIKEIGFSVIAMTLTLAAAYAPIGFSNGFTAAVFREFAFTLAGSVLISGFVALTLSPMMCAEVLQPKASSSSLQIKIDAGILALTALYQRFLTQALNKRFLVLGVLCVLGLGGYGLYATLPQTFIPKEDVGYFSANITTPPGSSIDYTNGIMSRIEEIYQKVPQILSNAAFIFAGSATNFTTMQPWQERKLSTQEVIDQLRPTLNAIPGALISVAIPNPVNYGNDTDGSDINVHVMTFGSYQELQETVDQVKKSLQKYPGLIEVYSNLKYDNQVYELQFKRSEAALLSINLQDVAETISTMLSGKHVTDFQDKDQTYEVRVQMNLAELGSFSSFNNIYVRSANLNPNTQLGEMIPLSNLASLTPGVRQSHLYHTNRMRSADITANLAPGFSLNTTSDYLSTLLTQTLKSNESFQFGGVIDAFKQSNNTMFWLFLLSIVFIYLVLAAQFESFVDPFIILFSVPLCIVGALGTLKLTGGSLNLYTNIGLITLVGLITKHGILITQFANACLLKGDASLREAILQAATTRLRPILMTTLTMVLGALPLALASGPGSISHQQIGWVIVGGMTFGTFFSLVVVPIAYYLLATLDFKKKELLLNRTPMTP